MDTAFAPAERATPKSVEHDAKLVSMDGLFTHIVRAVPYALMILNRQRQVVYANQHLLNMLQAQPDTQVLGKRPGELLDCVHAYEGPGGCGTSEHCCVCGAVTTILKSHDTKTANAECRVTTMSGQACEFGVWASSVAHEGRQFTVCGLEDLSDTKRRLALERTFCHDLNNVLAAIQGNSSLLGMCDSEQDVAECIEAIQLASRQLAEEVCSHRRLLMAENGELLVDVEDVQSVSLLKDVAALYSSVRQWAGRKIVVNKSAADTKLRTDKTLLTRVLGNMVKNALESTSSEDTVSLSCDATDDEVAFSVHNPGSIPRQVQLQLFQRSFSTKGNGRGIGTHSMKLFGERYLKGTVGFSTSEEDGTTFHISVPTVLPEH